MNELYSNEINLLTFNISVKGNQLAPLSLPKARIWTSSTQNFETLPQELNVVKEGLEYKVLIPYAIVRNKRFAKLDFEYELQDYGPNTISEFYEIDSRLVSFEELNSNLGKDSVGDSYGVEYWKYDRAEKVVRKIINTYCNQRFNQWEGTRKIKGFSSAINLPQHMEKLISVASGYTDIDFFDNYDIGDFTLSESGKTLNISAPWVKPSVYARKVDSSQLYLIRGIWGYAGVPEAVKEAALELIRFYMSDDAESRRKFFLNVNSDSNSSYTFNFSAYRDSTGNPVADELLSSYRIYHINAV